MKKLLILFLMVFMFIPAIASCESTTKTLDQDTDMHPQGWATGTLKFKEGTNVILNEDGSVVTGTLLYNEYLPPVGSTFVVKSGIFNTREFYLLYFKANCPVTFSKDGDVISGTIAEGCWISLVKNHNYAPKIFKENTVIVFSDEGRVLKGTMDETSDLRPVGWKNFLSNDKNAGFLTFKSGTEILFDQYSHVVKGTIAKDLTVNGTTYPAGTTLQFSETSPPQVAQ